MVQTVDQALQKGIEAHKAGKLQEADQLYTAILKADPKHPDANHNMGILAVGVNKVEAALPFLKTALESNPKIDQFWLSYIDALIKLNRIDDAKKVLAQAKSKGAKGDGFDKLEQRMQEAHTQNAKTQDPPEDQLKALLDLYNQGQYQEAQTQASKSLLKHPNSVILYNISGAAYKGIGKLKEAIDSYNKAISIKPNYADSYNNKGVALQEQGKFQQATEAFNTALSIKPNYAEAIYNKGIAFKEQGKLAKAIEAYKKVVFIIPDHADAYNNMGAALREQGNLKQAIEAFEKAISIKPNFVEAHNNRGLALQEQGKLEQATQALNRAISIKPDYAEAYNSLGNTLQDQGKLQEAVEAYNKALSLQPDYAEGYYNKGIALQDQGKLKEAIKSYNKALLIKPNYAEVYRNLSFIKKYSPGDPQFSHLQRSLQDEAMTETAKCHLNFALSKMYEDIGKLDKALEYLKDGNSLRKKVLKYSIEKDRDLFMKLKKAHPYLLENSLQLNRDSNRVIPIFILGMPRSGTTLIEQVISSHSKLTGVGELDYVKQFGFKLATDPATVNIDSISTFRQKYLSKVVNLSKGKQFVTDKMPHNFYFIPLIRAAIPEAKIIHVKRLAAATCWSNYKQYFASKSLGYCYDIDDITAYYKLYTELMDIWQSDYGDKIYNLNYDQLIAEQENETKKVIQYLELDWEEACLSPHLNTRSVRTASQQQVRKKVYQGSSDAWKKYEPFLNGAFDNLPPSKDI